MVWLLLEHNWSRDDVEMFFCCCGGGIRFYPALEFSVCDRSAGSWQELLSAGNQSSAVEEPLAVGVVQALGLSPETHPVFTHADWLLQCGMLCQNVH